LAKKNNIKPNPHGVEVTLDPEWLLNHAVYMPDGKTVHKSNITLGQVIEFIALARLNVTAPQPKENVRFAKIEFRDGKFHVHFAEDVDYLAE